MNKPLPKSKAALNTFLRRDIFAAHKRNGVCSKVDRKFPALPGNATLVETVADDGTINVDYAGDPHATREQIDAYVAEFCRLNHLKA
jgi:hypothetical protein